MAVVPRQWLNSDLPLSRNRDSWWGKSDSWMDDWRGWPKGWPTPRELIGRFNRDSDEFWRDWPSEWPRMDAVMPRLTSHLDSMDRKWREDPFWRDLYPRWAEPIFKEGIDVHSNIVNDRSRFAVDIDCYQFKPEEIQVKTLDDTLLIEGRHEDVRDRDNFTKMYFVRKYQLPSDVDSAQISSSIDARGRLTVEARKRNASIGGRERVIPIEGGSSRHRSHSNSPRSRHDSGYSNGYSPRGIYSPMHVDTNGSVSGRDAVRERETRYDSSEAELRRDLEIREREDRPYRAVGGDRIEVPVRQTGLPFAGYSKNDSSLAHRSSSRSHTNLTTAANYEDNRREYGGRRSSIDNRYHDDRAYSPHRITMDNEYRAHGGGYRSQSRSSSRHEYQDNGNYRVDSPSSYSHHPRETAYPGETRTQSVRSLRIERKTQY